MADSPSQLTPGKIPGQTLGMRLAEQPVISVSQALQWIRLLSDQVAAFHETDRLHRAIAPEAVRLTDGARPILSPPSAAAIRVGANRETSDILLELSRVAHLEIPPEITAARRQFLKAGITLDPRQIDLCQLGALWCRMMTGESAQGYLRSPRVKGKVPAELRPILERALGRGGQEGFTDARQFLSALKAVSEQATTPIEPVTPAGRPMNAPAPDSRDGARSIADTTPSIVSAANQPATHRSVPASHPAMVLLRPTGRHWVARVSPTARPRSRVCRISRSSSVSARWNG